MEKRRKYTIPILAVLLIIAFVQLYAVKSEKDVLQKNLDKVFTDAIGDCMEGLNRDYSQSSQEDKIRYYYQVVSGLNDAQDVFSSTSYKKYDSLFLALNRLYIYLITNHNETYEIEGKIKIFEFLGKVLVYPNDEKLITDFNTFLDNLNK